MEDLEPSREQHLFEPILGANREMPEKSTAKWGEVNYDVRIGGGEVVEDSGVISVVIRPDDKRSPANFYRLAADGAVYEVDPHSGNYVEVGEEDIIRITGILSSRTPVSRPSSDDVAEVGKVA